MKSGWLSSLLHKSIGASSNDKSKLHSEKESRRQD